MLRIGVTSDTHGFLRPEAEAILRSCDRIIHGGDIGSEQILQRLREMALTVAVRGNVDREAWAEQLPLSATVTWEDVTIHTIHDVQTLQSDPGTERFEIVISGHSHQPGIVKRNGVTYLNPGAAGRRRFRLPVTMALLHLTGHRRFVIEPITLID